MKKNLKSFLFILFFILTGLFANNTFAEECIINDVNFSPIDLNKSVEAQITTITIEFSGCTSGIEVVPMEIKQETNTNKSNHGQLISNSSQKITVKNSPNNFYIPKTGSQEIKIVYLLYENGCYQAQEDFDCYWYLDIFHNGKKLEGDFGKKIILSLKTKDDFKKIGGLR